MISQQAAANSAGQQALIDGAIARRNLTLIRTTLVKVEISKMSHKEVIAAIKAEGF